MKRKKSIILVTIGMCLIFTGAILTIFLPKKASKDYDDANRAYSMDASFKEKNGKVYVELKYTNENEKPVIINKVKLNIYNSESKKSIHEENLEVNKTVDSKKTVTIKFKDLNKSIEELADYYPDVVIN